MMCSENIMMIDIEISSTISSEILTIIFLVLMQCLQFRHFFNCLILQSNTFLHFFLQFDDSRRHLFDDSNNEILRNFFISDASKFDMNSISNKMISTNIAAMKEAQDYLMKDE